LSAATVLELILVAVTAVFSILAFVASRKAQTSSSLRDKLTEIQLDLTQRLAETSGNSVLRTQEKLSAEMNLVRDVLTRETLASRTSLEAALAQSRSESRTVMQEVTLGLENKFLLLQKTTEEKLESIRGEVDKKLSETVNKNFESFNQVTKRLEELQSVTGQMIQLSHGVKDLQRILESPKLRGDLGEFQLGEMLRQILPEDCFEEQFAIDPSGKERVDAVIKLKEGFLCIDSKFALDNVRRLFEEDLSDDARKALVKMFAGDVKAMVDSIAAKYIIPDRTLDFALMFIPAELVFHEVLRNSELHSYCLKKHVIPVSPSSFYAYLQAIAVGFRGLKIQAEAKKIEAVLGRLKKDFERFGVDFMKVGKHLRDASTQYANVEDRVDKIGRVIEKLGLENSLESQGEPLVLTATEQTEPVAEPEV